LTVVAGSLVIVTIYLIIDNISDLLVLDFYI